MRRKNAGNLFAERLHILTEFCKEHGHCKVPKAYANCPPLYKWLLRQIRHFGEGKLSIEQADALNALGVDLDPVIPYSEEDVCQRLQVLRRYRLETKSNGIPTRNVADPEYVAFAQWLVRMRRNIQGGLVSDKSISMLEGAMIDMDHRSAGHGLSAQEAEAFERNFSVLRQWLQDKERQDRRRNLTYQDAQRHPNARMAYRFIEHMLQKRRQKVLAATHLRRLISLEFTVNGQRQFTSLLPGPSIRSVQYFQESRYS